MGKRKKRREHSGSGGSSSNSSDTKLVSSVLNETNTVTRRDSHAEFCPVKCTSTASSDINTCNEQSAAVYADVKFSYFVSIFKLG